MVEVSYLYNILYHTSLFSIDCCLSDLYPLSDDLTTDGQFYMTLKRWHCFFWAKGGVVVRARANILVRLQMANMKNCLTPKSPKMCDPILVTLLKMRPHYSQSSCENATPSSGTSPLASYREVPHRSPAVVGSPPCPERFSPFPPVFPCLL